MTKDSADLSWTAPEKDGGAKITHYIVEMRERGDSKWKNIDKATSTTHTVTGLKEGQEYEFRVIAENKAGQGPPSGPSKPRQYSMY